MIQNDASAAATVPKFPRPNHSVWCKIAIYLGCASLVACGIVTLVFSFKPFHSLSRVFLAFYLPIFGVMVVCTELRLMIAVRAFGFLCTRFGLGIFFIFAGTLGLSFGVGRHVGVLVPFISGICWCIIGALCITDTALQSKRTQATANVVEAV